MVQTEQQYICIHQCLMAVLEGKENSGPPREIHDNQGYEGKIIGSRVGRNFGVVFEQLTEKWCWFFFLY